MTPPDALIVFAKTPQPGRVKTRLTTLLTPEEAAALYDAFLRDALDGYAALKTDLGRPVALRLYLTPESPPLPPADATGPLPGHTQHRQAGDGLGDRMLGALAESLAAGAQRAVVVGTDHPTLPPAFLAEAFRRLETPLTAVLGPSEDGGYYLLGLNDLSPAPFRAMTYSHDGVFEQTLERIAASPLSPVVLPSWYDVDTPAELARLLRDAEAGQPMGARTRRALGDLKARYAETLKSL